MRLGAAEVRFTTVDDGDFSDGALAGSRAAAQRSVVDLPWKTVHQVHGVAVAVVDRTTDTAGIDADALLTSDSGVALAVRTADCAPVALASDGVVAVAHAGWQGLSAGVLEETAAAMRARSGGRVIAALGPCIHPECYEFSPNDLDSLASHFGDSVRGVTAEGRPALDVPAAVRAALAAADVELVHDENVCTACSESHWSHRARRDGQRQATVVWLP